MLQLLFNLIQCDAPRPWGIYFQDSAAPQMEGLVELHDNIMFYLVLILFGVSWILTSVIVNYASSKSPISYKYFRMYIIEWIFTITPYIILILIVFSSLKLEYNMDPEKDSGTLLMATVEASSFNTPSLSWRAGLIGGATIWLIWGLNRESLVQIEGAETDEVVLLNSDNKEGVEQMLRNESGATRFGFQEGGAHDTITDLYIAIVRSISEGLLGVLEVSRQVFSDSMTWLVNGRAWELISSDEMWIEYTLLGGLCLQISNFRIMDILSLFYNTNTNRNIGGILGEMFWRFLDLVEEITLSSRYINQPILFASINSTVIFMNPFSFPDFELDIGDRFDYRLLVTDVSPIERRWLDNSRHRYIEIFDGDVTEFYEHNPEEVEGYDDLYEDEEPPAK